MKVKKKNGNIQDFDLSKIKTSIEKASDDAKRPMNLSDIENTASDIEEYILKNFEDEINYLEIRNIVTKILKKNGFKYVEKSYNNI